MTKLPKKQEPNGLPALKNLCKSA